MFNVQARSAGLGIIFLGDCSSYLSNVDLYVPNVTSLLAVFFLQFLPKGRF